MEHGNVMLNLALSMLAADQSIPNDASFGKIKECLGPFQALQGFPPSQELDSLAKYIRKTFCAKRIECIQKLAETENEEGDETSVASESPEKNGTEEDGDDARDSSYESSDDLDEDNEERTDEDDSEDNGGDLWIEEDPRMDGDMEKLLISVHHPDKLEWTGGGALFCHNDISFVDLRWMHMHKLAAEAASIQLLWTYEKKKTYMITFYIKENLDSDFILGAKRFDPGFDRDHLDPVVVDTSDEPKVTHGYRNVEGWVQEQPTPQTLPQLPSPPLQLDADYAGRMMAAFMFEMGRKGMESLMPMQQPQLRQVYTENSASTQSTSSNMKRKPNQGSQGPKTASDAKSKSEKSSTTNKSAKSSGKASKSDKGMGSKQSSKSSSFKSAKSNSSTVKADSTGRQRK